QPSLLLLRLLIVSLTLIYRIEAVAAHQIIYSSLRTQSKLEEEIKTAMPEIRSKLLLLLSSKKPSELVSVAGKQQLVQQVIGEVNAVLGVAPAPAAAVAEHDAEHAAPAVANPAGITDVLFTDFIIQ
ncbi:flagellar basal body-associated protein FliL, partial [Ferrigenium sp. UT5]|uniref:flagellar basal body-associated FliL family protein n=1 Tax=Ferrigenium sp. UT5 TaxID=3242105 RepID=UPI0038B37EAD